MDKKEYNRLKRFEVNFQMSFLDFLGRLKMPQNVIFECWTIHNHLTLLKITDQIDNYLFDLVECDQEGKEVRMAYRIYSVSLVEIAKRIYAGDWRMTE